MGKVIRLWDIDGENPHIPNEDELNSLLENVGYEKVTLDGNEVTMPEGVTLYLGAAGKGIGCDAAKQILENHEEVSGMILNLGGSSVMSYGSKPDGSSWQVAVTDPRDTEGDYLGVVALNGTEFLSTSGDYEKYFIEDGVRYHHLLDPSIGYPARSGLTSDGQQLYILTQEEMERQGLDPAEMAGASDGQMNGSAGTGQNTGIAAQAQQDNRININTADETQLTTLTGIGATRAQAIIAYRQENGPFAAIEEIMNVQGIKEGTFAKIKDEIVVG